jgi:HK97 family phage portal protein
MLFDLFGGSEKRNLENPKYSLTDPSNWFNTSSRAASGVDVSEEKALGVPAIFHAVNLISNTIANLPLHLYKVDGDGQPQKATSDPLYRVVHDRANDVHTKFAFFKWIVHRALASPKGRGLALILRNGAGRVAGFMPLDESTVTVEQSTANGRLVRTYTVGTKRYEAWEVLDLAPILAMNGMDALSPIMMNRDAIAAMIEAEAYATALFANGGVPPLTLTGNHTSPIAADRASEQVSNALRAGRNPSRKVLPIPMGFDLKNLGFDPASQQMIELRRFQISEASRIFNVAPALLFDLSTGTYSNVEQQSLSFATQTITPLVKLIEQELNLKLFGGNPKTRQNLTNYVEFNVDALVRGDLKSRMEALARSVNAALLTPDEARALDNRPAMPGGDRLYIQGATVPLEDAGKTVPAPLTAPTPEEPIKEDINEVDDNGTA